MASLTFSVASIFIGFLVRVKPLF